MIESHPVISIWEDLFKLTEHENIFFLGANASYVMEMIGRWYFDSTNMYTMHSVPLQLLLAGGIAPVFSLAFIFFGYSPCFPIKNRNRILYVAVFPSFSQSH